METNTRGISIAEQNLQELYWKYAIAKWNECVDKKTTNRLVIQFDRGIVTSIQSQEIITGVSVMVDYLSQFAPV